LTDREAESPDTAAGIGQTMAERAGSG